MYSQGTIYGVLYLCTKRYMFNEDEIYIMIHLGLIYFSLQ